MEISLPIFAGVSPIEALSVAIGLVAINWVVWLVACNYAVHPDLDVSGAELFRKLPYPFMTWPKLASALLCMLSYLMWTSGVRAGNDPSTLLLISIIAYIIYMALCVVDAHKVLKEYIK